MQAEIEKLNQYHLSNKVKTGIDYVAQPPQAEPKPVAPDPMVTAGNQIATAYWELSKIHRNLGDSL